MAEVGVLQRRKIWIFLGILLILALTAWFVTEARKAEQEIREAENAASGALLNPLEGKRSFRATLNMHEGRQLCRPSCV